MGILKAVIASVESTFGDQWKELFYCEALPDTTLIVRGQKYVSRYAENTNGNTIRDGSIICCADGQCAFYLALLYVLDGLGYHMAIVRQFLFGKLVVLMKSFLLVSGYLAGAFTRGGAQFVIHRLKSDFIQGK